jgi:hypothetical protein
MGGVWRGFLFGTFYIFVFRERSAEPKAFFGLWAQKLKDPASPRSIGGYSQNKATIKHQYSSDKASMKHASRGMLEL